MPENKTAAPITPLKSSMQCSSLSICFLFKKQTYLTFCSVYSFNRMKTNSLEYAYPPDYQSIPVIIQRPSGIDWPTESSKEGPNILTTNASAATD
jgi:hypothetical protein